uniref:Cyclin dependent kinase inhibitor n=1 Tax=Zea mays TaxID=4577 RepID=B6UEC9_MAIZE|nr:cyclin dependent kinase inhibitor [Zea mays]
MGKYMRKGKVSGEVAVMEVPGGALLGVRTRSRTLALQRAQRPLDKGDAEDAAAEYLELRSRRLEKPHKEHPPPPAPAPAPATKRGAGRKAAAAAAVQHVLMQDEDEVEAEVSFGDNVLDLDTMLVSVLPLD